jgi:RNA polymerase sigma-70 factor (ECF subfamily)
MSAGQFEDISSEELVERALVSPAGDHAAFEELVLRHRGKVLANCRYLTRAEDDAEDLTQEVFVKAFFKLRTFEGRSRFRTWLQRIKVNHCLNFMRGKKSRAFLETDALDVETAEAVNVQVTPASDADRHAVRESIEMVLEAMPDTMRVPLILCDMDGLSYQEAADQLGIGLSAFKMRLKRAREQFRELYRALE